MIKMVVWSVEEVYFKTFLHFFFFFFLQTNKEDTHFPVINLQHTHTHTHTHAFFFLFQIGQTTKSNFVEYIIMQT